MNYLAKTIFALLFLVVFNIANAQKIITITLFVDTDSITQTTVDKYANFGQLAGVSNEDFNIDAYLGDTIEWKGVSTSSNPVKVEITKIKYEKGVDVFNKKDINGNNGKAKGVIKNGAAGDVEKYKIFFKVEGKPGVFKIDPKITIKSM